MKMPIKCPICNGVMLTEHYTLLNKKESYRKSCTQINHDIYYLSETSIDNVDDVEHFGVYINKHVSAYWFPNLSTGKQFVMITKGKKIDNPLYLPYFEPDFSNYKQLVEKIKTYLVFS
jgi:hypothetical protein